MKRLALRGSARCELSTEAFLLEVGGYVCREVGTCIGGIPVDRVRTLQTELLRRGEAAALITSIENLRYFTGFYVWNSVSPFALALVPAVGDSVLFVLRADESLARALAHMRVEPYDAGAQGFKTTVQLCRRDLEKREVAPGRLGLEFGSVTIDRLRILEEAFPRWTFTDITATVGEFRLIKDATEQVALRRAAELVSWAMQQTLSTLRPGLSELELKAAMDFAAYTEEARRWPEAVVHSQTNVVTGPKVNRLHDAATGRTVAAGEMAFMMGGASLNGYWANIARTVFVPGGQPRPDAQRVLEVATRAQRAAVNQLAPGVALGEAARAADKVLASEHLAEKKTYPVFRGLGLRIDERPRALDVDMILNPGMCLCAQLYLSLPEFIVGRSDSVLITDKGAELLGVPLAQETPGAQSIKGRR